MILSQINYALSRTPNVPILPVLEPMLMFVVSPIRDVFGFVLVRVSTSAVSLEHELIFIWLPNGGRYPIDLL